MSEEDELAFLRAVETYGVVKVFSTVSPIAEFVPLEKLPQSGEFGWFQLWLWSPDRCKPPQSRQVDRTGKYWLDGHASEVVEFLRTTTVDGVIHPGRLWMEPFHGEAGSPELLVEKSRDFVRWYNQLCGWIKKNWQKTDGNIYVGPGVRILGR